MAQTLPTISIVTPSLNRTRYLGETMDSVLSQRYPGLEYVVVDGGSTDGSAELIASRSAELAWWVSEPDEGAWAAINKGFDRTSGEVMGWLGSDDLLMPWSLAVVGEIFAAFPQIGWLTTLYPTQCDEEGRAVRSYRLDAYDRDAFFRGANLPFAGWPAAGFVQQEATFWRRSVWEAAGGLDESLLLAADFDLWARFHRSGTDLYGVAVPLACFRRHGDQKSLTEFDGYIAEARGVLLRYGGKPPQIVADVRPSLVRRIMRVALPERLRDSLGAAVDHFREPPTQPDTHRRVIHGGPNVGWQIFAGSSLGQPVDDEP